MTKLRWEDYFIKSESEFQHFWDGYQQSRDPDILYIMGIGFDPRTNYGIRTVFNQPSSKRRDTLVLRYFKTKDETDDSPSRDIELHMRELNDFLEIGGFSKPNYKNIILRSDDDKSVAAINATNIINNISDFSNYSDVVIDISAMPRSIFIPLVNKCLTIVDDYNLNKPIKKKNLHVVVTENPELDSIIYDRGSDEEATFIHGFRIKQIHRTRDQKEVWIPLLGERQTEQFKKIKVKLNPIEVCPILPFPSENLRRGDELISSAQIRVL